MICLQSSGPPTCGCRSTPGFPALQLSDLWWALGVGGHAGRLGMDWYSKCAYQDGWLPGFTQLLSRVASRFVWTWIWNTIGFYVLCTDGGCRFLQPYERWPRCPCLSAHDIFELSGGIDLKDVEGKSKHVWFLHYFETLCNSTWGLNPSALEKVPATQSFSWWGDVLGGVWSRFSLCQSCESIVFLSVDIGVAYLGDIGLRLGPRFPCLRLLPQNGQDADAFLAAKSSPIQSWRQVVQLATSSGLKQVNCSTKSVMNSKKQGVEEFESQNRQVWVIFLCHFGLEWFCCLVSWLKGDALVLFLRGEGEDATPVMSDSATAIDEVLGGPCSFLGRAGVWAQPNNLGHGLRWLEIRDTDLKFKRKFLSWVEATEHRFHSQCVDSAGAISAFIKEESFEAKSGAAATFPVFGKVDLVFGSNSIFSESRNHQNMLWVDPSLWLCYGKLTAGAQKWRFGSDDCFFQLGDL